MGEATPDQYTAALAAFAKLGYIPATPVLAAAATAASDALARGPAGPAALAPRDMAELCWAFAKSEFRPPEALLQRVLQRFGQCLDVLPSQRVAQLLWALAQFGAPPPLPLLSNVAAVAAAALATYPPESLAQLLSAMHAFGLDLARGPLLPAAAERVAAALPAFKPQALTDVVAVFAARRYHPGGHLLAAAAAQISAQIAQSEAGGGAAPLPARAAAALLRAYATLAYAPPTALLQQLTRALAPAVGELELASLSEVLAGMQLFRGLTPALWNPACGVLASALAAEGVPAPALVKLYNVHVMVCREPNAASFESPPALIAAARNHWAAAAAAAAATQLTPLQRDVQRRLAALGVPHGVNVPAGEGLMPLALALPNRRIAVEALGPEAFCVNAHPGQQPQPLGDTVLRVHSLAALGWQAVTVAHYDFYAQAGDQAKDRYLYSLLGMA